MNEIKPQPLPTPSGLKNAQTSKDSEMQSTIGKAIELLSQGTRLPRYMIE